MISGHLELAHPAGSILSDSEHPGIPSTFPLGLHLGAYKSKPVTSSPKRKSFGRAFSGLGLPSASNLVAPLAEGLRSESVSVPLRALVVRG